MNKTLGALLWMVWALGFPAAQAGGVSSTRLSVDDSIRAAADALGRLVQESGQFTYDVSLDGKPLPQNYNVLHHAGAAYYLSLYLKQFPDGQDVGAIRQAIVRASRFLVQRSIHSVSAKGRKLEAAYSIPELASKENSRDKDAMLGSSGLGVLALIASERIQPGSVNRELIHRMGEFLLFLQKKDGSFYDGFVPAQGGRLDKWHSILYPGEAILGLIELYQWDHDRKWLRAAHNGLLYLAKDGANLYRNSGQPLLDNWALKAAAELWKIPGALSTAEQRLVLQYTVLVCQADLNWQTQIETTVAAVGLEGLTAALTYLPNTLPGLRRMLKARADQDVAFLIHAQVPSGPYKGMIPDSPGGTFVQIDIIWHALNGLMQYRDISSLKY